MAAKSRPKYSKHPPRKHAPYLRTRHVIRGKNRSEVTKFFQGVPWDKWWTEFLTLRERNGRMKYLTAYQFAKAKAKSDMQMDVIYRAIGPKPISIKDVRQEQASPARKVPYLGDWQQIRAKAYFYDNETVDTLKKATEEQLNGLEAGKGAAKIVLELIMKWVNYDAKIDELFQASPVRLENSVTQNDKHAKVFLGLKDRTRTAIAQLVELFLACHGITHNGMNALGQLAMTVAQAGAKSALMGAAAAGALDPSSQAALALSNSILEKARIFHMALPAAVAPEGEASEDESGEPEG